MKRGVHRMRISKKKLMIAQAKALLGNRELAELASVSPNTIVIAGKVDMQPVTIGKIAKALGVEVTDIIEEEN